MVGCLTCLSHLYLLSFSAKCPAKVHSEMGFKHCRFGYSMGSQDEGDYKIGWQPVNKSGNADGKCNYSLVKNYCSLVTNSMFYVCYGYQTLMLEKQTPLHSFLNNHVARPYFKNLYHIIGENMQGG